MSKVHILTGDENENYHAVIHFPVPAGNNSAGQSWKDVLVADGNNKTVLININAQELTDIQSGVVVEFVTILRRAESGGGSDSQITAMVNDLIEEEKKRLARKYKYYGRVF